MEDKVTMLKRLNMLDLEANGLNFSSEKMSYCDVPVFRIKSWNNIVVFREGNWESFPYKELQEHFGKGAEVVSVSYIMAFNTTIIIFKDSGPVPHFEKEIITNGTGEDFSISICECEYLRPPFIPIWNYEI
ncbi:MAG: hypothetical protein UH625_02910 [Muribaculaceae bacterium]|nr:hypothetical protein [Muribaculaceae bacterium]